jgi:hypothetical protein
VLIFEHLQDFVKGAIECGPDLPLFFLGKTPFAVADLQRPYDGGPSEGISLDHELGAVVDECDKNVKSLRFLFLAKLQVWQDAQDETWAHETKGWGNVLKGVPKQGGCGEGGAVNKMTLAAVAGNGPLR